MWIHGLFSYYCVNSQTIVLHRGPLQSLEYSWRDVIRLETGCTRTRGGTEALFNLHLKDGSTLHLGSSSWRMTTAHYADVIAALSGSQ